MRLVPGMAHRGTLVRARSVGHGRFRQVGSARTSIEFDALRELVLKLGLLGAEPS